MLIVDNALKKLSQENTPLRVGMIGAGFMGRGIARQIVKYTTGMRLVAISSRKLEAGLAAYRGVGASDVKYVSDKRTFDKWVTSGIPVVTEDPSLLLQSREIDICLEVTGSVSFGAQIALEAISQGKNLVTLSAELDATLGAIIKRRASEAGVVFSGADGDQPGVQVNLARFVQGMGLRPLLCGNIKGLHDPYRTPKTQKAFAEKWGQSPYMVTSFADGTKISFEQASVGNAMDMGVACRGMTGWNFSEHVDELAKTLDAEELIARGGQVDYVVGAKPAPGVFVFAMSDDPSQMHYLDLYKLGRGPLYSFYTPYHLCHFEVPNSLARVALFGDTVIAPQEAPVVDVIATAKQDLTPNMLLDGIGGFLTYGLAENARTVIQQRLLPMGLAEGCRVLRHVPKDQVLTYEDVELPEDRLVDQLREEQSKVFFEV